MRPYSMDLRERVIAACDFRDGTRRQIARRFGVSESWVRKLLRRRRETGSIAPRPQNAGRKRALTDRQLARLRRLVERRPAATLRELRDTLRLAASISAIDRAVRGLGLTFKTTRLRLGGRTRTRSPRRAAVRRRRASA